MICRWENFFNAAMAFAKATSRSVIAVVLRLPRLCGLGLVALRTVLLQDLDLAKVGVEGSNPFARSKT